METRFLAIMLPLITVLTGCATSTTAPTRLAPDLYQNVVGFTELVIETEPSRDLAVDENSFSVDVYAGAAGIDAGLRSAATVPGYNAAAGFAGAVVGLQLAKSFQSQNAKDKLYKPVSEVRTNFIARWHSFDIATGLETAIKSENTMALDECLRREQVDCQYQLILTPEFALSSDYRMLHTSLLAEIKDSEDTLYYSNTLDYYSQPIPGVLDGDTNATWMAEDFAALRERVNDSFAELINLLHMDLASDHGLVNANQSSAIRYLNEAGVFSERGVVLSSDDMRLRYITLDGRVKSVHAEKVLDSEEFYSLMSEAPPADNAPEQQD